MLRQSQSLCDLERKQNYWDCNVQFLALESTGKRGTRINSQLQLVDQDLIGSRPFAEPETAEFAILLLPDRLLEGNAGHFTPALDSDRAADGSKPWALFEILWTVVSWSFR